MKKIAMIIIAIYAIGFSGCNTTQVGVNTGGGNQQQNVEGPTTVVNANLSFRGWYPWSDDLSDDLQAIANGNTVTLTGKFNVAGYVSEQISQSLSKSTVVLEIPNAAASNFSGDRLMKITVNKDDRLIKPNNVLNLIEREYVPSDYKSVEFDLPDDFDGKLGFVFYQADLRGLQITATYRQQGTTR